ncbi:MAG: class II aldolase/adducin family protein [Actinophytocola sp.]|uniref:class II aldolase/adducin family protein n=1 Tax=Actinophytocola sp. TaxID=1872138 RepID=UPI003C73837A
MSRPLLAAACRILAARGLADGFLGHVSQRAGDELLLVRCRGPMERGLAFTEPADIRLVTFDGGPGAPGELDGYVPPNELPLHAEVLRRRPEVAAVVHAHPAAVVAADLAGIAIRPVVGAYDIPGAALARGGVPVYPRGVLVRDRELAGEMTAAMGDRPVVLLRGHGLTSAAPSVEQAVLQAVSVDRIAALSLAVRSAGGTLADLPDADLDQLPDLGAGFTVAVAWRHELARIGDEPVHTMPLGSLP